MRELLGYIAALALVGAGLVVLGAILRFSVVGPRRVRAERRYLRVPDPLGVARVCGFPVPEDLVVLYRTASYLDDTEFNLVDTSTPARTAWPIGRFLPLRSNTAAEWRTVSRVPGIPIAIDVDKGVYFVDDSGAVLFSAGRAPHVVVAPSIRLFEQFTPETSRNR